jgi:hypothetical protein
MPKYQFAVILEVEADSYYDGETHMAAVVEHLNKEPQLESQPTVYSYRYMAHFVINYATDNEGQRVVYLHPKNQSLDNGGWKSVPICSRNENIPKSVERSDAWIPACGGTEKPFVSRSGKKLLYCYQASSGNHAYLDVDNDIILSDEDAIRYLS